MSRYWANRVSLFTMRVPLFGVTVDRLVFNEKLKPIHYAGGSLLLAGLFVNPLGARLFARLQCKASK